MSTAFPATSAKFVGRDEYIARFKSRVEHFQLFIYEGISGTGKTSLILRLAKETRAVGITNGMFLTVWPGETIGSILARVEARFKRVALSTERQGDPFSRLIDRLEQQKTVLLLDGFHDIRREDRPAMARAFRGRQGRYRVIATSRGDPELSAMDRVMVHLERVGGFTHAEVSKIAGQFKLKEPALQQLLDDVERGGASAHPLTLMYMLSLGNGELPSAELLAKQTARSVNAFRSVMGEIGERIGDEQRRALTNLARIGLPIGKPTAHKAFGAVIERLVKERLLDVIDGDVRVHHLVSMYLGSGDSDISVNAAKIIAKHLESRAGSRGEPMALTRAGEILAHAGAGEAAVDTLASGWESVRDLGFLEAYLKTLSTIDAKGGLEPRVKLLSARARMRKGQPERVKDEMQALSKSRDKWTRSRALAALVYIHATLKEHKDVVASYDALKKTTTDNNLCTPAGIHAAASLVRLGKASEAERLAKGLLAKLKGKKQHDREGELRRLMARVYAHSGRLDMAVKEALYAAKAFEAGGDLYHAATAHGFVGDLYRETGDFEDAKEAFGKFRTLATSWGDRDLIQIAELAEAWVFLDIGDLTSAAQRIAQGALRRRDDCVVI